MTATNNQFSDRFYQERTPVWSKIGKQVPDGMTAVKAVKKFGFDYTVDTYPQEIVISDSLRIPSKKHAILRSPMKGSSDYVEFGTASEAYEIVQNLELAKMIEPLVEVWPLEVIGAAKEGKLFFMVMNAGYTDINGDEISNYFTLVDTKDGGTAVKIFYTPVRMFCANLLNTALRQATINVTMQHIRGVGKELKARMNLVAKMQTASDEVTLLFRQLASKRVKSNTVNDIVQAIYPMPKTPSDAALIDYSKEELGDVLFQAVADRMYAYNYYSQQAQNNQDTAIELFEQMNENFPANAGSLWHVYNAVVESADYRLGGGEPEVSAMFGARAREKKTAFKTVVNYL